MKPIEGFIALNHMGLPVIDRGQSYDVTVERESGDYKRSKPVLIIPAEAVKLILDKLKMGEHYCIDCPNESSCNSECLALEDLKEICEILAATGQRIKTMNYYYCSVHAGNFCIIKAESISGATDYMLAEFGRQHAPYLVRDAMDEDIDFYKSMGGMIHQAAGQEVE